VQVVQRCTVPGRSQPTVCCRVNCREISDLGVVEGVLGAVRLANSLNRLDEQGEFLVQCVNTFTEPVELPAGSLVGKFHSVQEEDVEPALETADETRRIPTRDGRGPVPENVAELYEDACDGCESKRKRLVMAQLLSEYKDVFSCGDHDMGLTKTVCHEISLAAGTAPIQQPTRRLGPEKEREVSRQVQDLLNRDLIEPGHEAWSSLVVLVRKKDGSWRFCVDYCRLNSVTIQDAYPLPKIDKSVDALAGSKFFSMLDLLNGYRQMPLSPEAQDKAAFITRNGLLKWKVLPFGLTSAPATFQRLIEQVLSGAPISKLMQELAG